MRKEDTKQSNPFRTERFFRTDLGWYNATREGNRGPFPTRLLAIGDAKNYVRRTIMNG